MIKEEGNIVTFPNESHVRASLEFYLTLENLRTVAVYDGNRILRLYESQNWLVYNCF